MFKDWLKGRTYSLPTLIMLLVILWTVRLLTPVAGTLTWDVFGYYLWLPAWFIHGDLWLDQFAWVQQVLDQVKPSETFYQGYIGPGGTWMYWFLFGMGYLYFPFFLVGHVVAITGGYPADGFSLPYQAAIAYGGLVYTLFGLFFLWKILKKFFSDRIVMMVLIVMVLGTNYLYFTSIGGAATANYLFTLVAGLLWVTILWHEQPTISKALVMGLFCGLITAIKPSEIVCVLLPFLWPAREGFMAKWDLVKKHWVHALIFCIAVFAVLFPQLYYWKQETGMWVFDSYKNAGIGLDFFNPHIGKVLFSFRKGWLIYTPVIIFALAGLGVMYYRKRDLFRPVAGYFLVTFYIIASWTEWWYGGGFSQRPLVVSYVVLSIAMGFFLEWILGWKVTRWFIGLIIISLVMLNLFQTWQYAHEVLHADRMSRAYYFKVFGKTQVDPEWRKLLLTERSYGVHDIFSDPERYERRNIGLYDFEEDPFPGFEPYYSSDTFHSPGYSLRMDSTLEFSTKVKISYAGLTQKDHAWLKASVWFYFVDSLKQPGPYLVVTTTHNGDNYKYRNFELKDKTPGKWQKLEFYYQTPEVRDPEDEIAVNVWNPGKRTFYMDDLRVDAFTLK